MIYDAIVVGAGPAGSTTARVCAEQGLSVLLLDKAEFPRDKPCGGGVTIRAAELLPFDISPVTERVVDGMYLSARQSNGFGRRYPRDLIYFTQRTKLDALLVEKATSAGAILRERATVRSVERGPNSVVVRSSDETFQARALVGADGANGVTAKMAGLQVSLALGVALEANVEAKKGWDSRSGPDPGFPTQWEHIFGLDIGTTPGGYGWIFPKSDHLNIGIGSWKYFGPNLRGKLEGLARYYGFDPSSLSRPRGHHLPMRNPNSALAEGNVLLVGDAAGLLDPLTGEGIYAGIWSGIAAAKHLQRYVSGESANLNGYQQEVELGLLPDLEISRRFHDVFHLTPRLYTSVERVTERLWDLICRLMRGEQTYAGVMRNHTSLANVVDFISDSIRVAPPLQRWAGLRDPAPPGRFFVRGRGQRKATQAF